MYNCFFILLLIFPINSGAQTIIRSEPFQLDKRGTDMEISGFTDNDIYLSFMGIKDYQVALYDMESLSMKWIRAFPEQNKQTIVEDVLCFSDTAFVFYSLNDNVNRKYFFRSLSFDEFNEDSGEKVFEYEINRSGFSSHFGIEKSFDQKQILAYVMYEKSKEEVEIKYVVLDSNMHITSKENIVLSMKFSDTRLKQALIQDGGKVQFLVYNRIEDRKESDPLKYQYFICTNKEQIVIQIGSLYLNNTNLKYNHKGLWVVGYYSDVGFEKINGLFALCFDVTSSSLKKVNEVMTPFSKELLERMIFKDPEKDTDVSNLDMIRIISRDDGGLMLFGEEKYSTVVNYSSPNMYNVYSMNSISYFHYNNILVSSLAPDGSIQWNNILRKKQMMENNYDVASCFVHIHPERLECFYNDDVNRNSTLINIQVSPNGKLSHNIISRNIFMIAKSIQLSNTEWLSLSANQGNIRLIKYQIE